MRCHGRTNTILKQYPSSSPSRLPPRHTTQIDRARFGTGGGRGRRLIESDARVRALPLSIDGKEKTWIIMIMIRGATERVCM